MSPLDAYDLNGQKEKDDLKQLHSDYDNNQS